MGPGGPGGPRSPGEPWGETSALGVTTAGGDRDLTPLQLQGALRDQSRPPRPLRRAGMAGGGRRSGTAPRMGSAPTCSPLSPGMPGAPGSPGSPTQSESGLSPCRERGRIRSQGQLWLLPAAEPCQGPPSAPKATSAPQSPSCSRKGGTVSCPAPAGTIPAAPWGPGSQTGVAAQPQGQGEGARQHGSLTRAASALGNWAKHWKKTQESPRDPLQGCIGGAAGYHGARSPASRTPRVLSTRCSSPHRPLHKTNLPPSPRTPLGQVGAVHGSLPACRVGPVCPERAQPCKRLLLCVTATRADAWGLGSISALHAKTQQDQGFLGTGIPTRRWAILTRAQLSLPGAPGMPPSPFSPLTPLGASKAACSWVQSPQRVWEEAGSQGHPEVLGVPWARPTVGRCPVPTLSPSAPRCSSRP